MITILFTSSIIALILLVWFKTEAWLEYTRLFRLNFLSFYKDFDMKQSEDASLTYHMYLRRYHNRFLVRLITCPICLATWLGILAGLVIFSGFFILGILSTDFLILAFGSLLLIPVYTLCGILLFSIVEKLLG
jgi:hypothetical protein